MTSPTLPVAESTLLYLIVNAPPMPISYRAYDGLPESQRVALWRLEYADIQIELMNSGPTQKSSSQFTPTPEPHSP